jgi:hypothetical protein
MIADTKEEANDFIDKKNHAKKIKFGQKENINWLNNRCVKLEQNLQLKTMSIGTLYKDVGTVSLVDDGNTDHHHVQNMANIEELAIAVNQEIYGAAVLLCDGLNKNVVVKVSWIRNFSNAQMMNDGLKSTTKYVVFYSTTMAENPNFNLSIASSYSQESALYVSNIYKFFGKKIECNFYYRHVN